MRMMILIGLFGAFGAISRAYLTKVIGTPGGFPLGTLSVNAIGSLFLGILTGCTLNSPMVPEEWRIPLATGFLGSLTTFSTFAVETLRLMEAQQWKTAGLYLLGQLMIGLFFAFFGLRLGKHLN